MSENNLSYRIRTVVGNDNPDYVGNLNVLLDQDYDTFEIMSLKIKSTDTYRLHNSNNGVIAGRVIANNGFGIPNAKISLFVEADASDNEELRHLYPYTTTASKNSNKIRYNLLPDNKVDDCHQVVGTFPNKSYMLENDVLLEIYDKYYKYTTRTNNSGDYMLIGVPTGNHTLHMDLDLSDCGILSQRPRDFVYKGYTIEQFENPNKFKTGTNLDNLSQIFSQDLSVTVNPFWGNSELGNTVGITRADINVAFKFEPTCVFIGSVVSDNASNGISKKCVPTNQMGSMEDLTTGEGRIEMIRKTPGGDVEEFQIKGTQLIDGNGIWCYQIPMNLDYMRTDEYGNMVPTDDPEKGVATRTMVRFRISMQDSELNKDNYFRAKVLVPNNPQNTKMGHEDYDYNFGTKTNETSYRDLFWNNVYTVKSYIPRFSRSQRWKNERFTGIKHCNIAGNNNPIPYNNIRIKLPLMFTLICALIKCYVFIVGLLNYFISRVGNTLADICNVDLIEVLLLGIGTALKKLLGIKTGLKPFKPIFGKFVKNLKLVTLKEGLCPDLDTWYFAPMKPMKKNYTVGDYDILEQTLKFLQKDYDIDDGEENALNNNTQPDSKSIDYQNGEWFNDDGESNDEAEKICLTKNTDYLIACIEMALAQEYKVINFDFYNDWINGLLYIPRWVREVKKKRKYWIFGKRQTKVKGCMNDATIFGRTRKYMQLCSLPYERTVTKIDDKTIITKINQVVKKTTAESQKFHKNSGKKKYNIFGKNGGIVHEATTIENQHVYYLKPCEWNGNGASSKKVNLFATDIVLLGSLNNCDIYGVPQLFKYLPTSSYRMPTNLALTNMETEGPLYADEDNTKCTDSGIKKGVKEITGDAMTLSAELEYYNGEDNKKLSGSNDGNYERLEYEANEGSDTIPVTEAAGVAWNYTGPGQGSSKNYKKTLYMPGGHFLGISCINSQTNKKSCVNLERMCELGSSISQRHENVRKVLGNEDGTGIEFKYVYNVPTGLIADDEIIDTDARSMFATLNQRRLIATKTNFETGYKYYNFAYRRPKGFGGEMGKFVENEGEYNTMVSIKDEDLTLFNIAEGRKNPDYDPEEASYTQRRTIEDLNLDYYLFRMGLEYDDLKEESNVSRKFLKNINYTYYLPQYENSYYFYFGLKDGATALDEFNKQFFAACDSSSLIKRVKDITVTEEKNICEDTGDIIVTLNNLEPEYTIRLTRINEGIYTNVDTIPVKVADDVYKFSNLEFGTYRVEVIDALENYFEKEIVLDVVISANVRIDHINAYKIYNRSEKDWWDGGLIKVSDIQVDGKSVKDGMDFRVCIDKDWDNGGFGGTVEMDLDVYEAGTYQLWLKYRCKDSVKYNERLIGTYQVKDTTGVSLFMGDDNDIQIIGGGNEEIKNWFDTGWWADLHKALRDDLSIQEKEEKKWALKHYLFAQNDVEEGTESFDSKITTTFSRVLYGQAQNKTGFSPEIYKQGDYTGEHVLTDKIGYWQTLDQNGQNARPYGTMAYDGNIVGGEYCGYYHYGFVNDRKITWKQANPQKVNVNGKDLIGLIAKSRNTKEIIYAKIEGGDKIKFDDPDCYLEDWVLFPLFRYPSIYRPFYATMFFFAHSDKIIDVVSDNNSNISPVVDFTNDNSKLIGEIYNGITYSHRSNDEVIEHWGDMQICGLPLGYKLSGDTASDINGITTTAAGFAKTVFRPQKIGLGKNDNVSPWIIESGVTEYSFLLNEGTPDSKANKAAQIEDTLSAAFWDNITYVANNGVGKFYGIGNGEDEDIIYYLIPKTYLIGTDKLMIDGNAQTLDQRIPLFYEDENLLYVLGKYNENAPQDQKGGTVFAILTGKEAKFSKTGTNGKTIEKISVDSVEDIIANPNLLMLNSYQKFYDKGMTLQATCPTLVKAEAEEDDAKIREAWAKAYEIVKSGEDKMINQYGCKIAKIDGKHFQLFDPEKETIIGIYRKNTGYRGRSGIVMLYPYFEKSSQYDLGKNEFYIIASPNPLIFAESGGTKTITIVANVDWEIVNIPDWVSIDSSQLTGKTGSTVVSMTVNTANNPDSTLLIRGVNDNSISETLAIKQTTGGETPGDTISKLIDNRCIDDTIVVTSVLEEISVAPKTTGSIKMRKSEFLRFKVTVYEKPWYIYGVISSGEATKIQTVTTNTTVTMTYNSIEKYTGFIISNENIWKGKIVIDNKSTGQVTIQRTSGFEEGSVTTIGAGVENVSYIVYQDNVILIKCTAQIGNGGWNIYNKKDEIINHGEGDQGVFFNGYILLRDVVGEENLYTNLKIRDAKENKS